MKKITLFSVFVAILLCAVSCEDTTKKGGSEEEPSYVVLKVNDVTDGVSQDFMEVKYTSTDPVDVSELIFFNWRNKYAPEMLPMMFRTKAAVIPKDIIFTNIVKTATTMTFDVEWLDSNGVTGEYGIYNITLNAEGYATLVKFTPHMEGVDEIIITAKYNTDGYISEFLCTEGDDDVDFVFTYDGINMSSVAFTYTVYSTRSQEKVSAVCQFTDYTTNNKGGVVHPALSDSGRFDVVTLLGVFGKPAKMLPSKSVWGDGKVVAFTYTKDANDCISTCTYEFSYGTDIAQDTYLQKYAYEYVELAPKK